jgi:hypothetical protein
LPWQFNLMDTVKARYMATKTKQKAKNDEIRGVIRDVNELRTEMREIKDLLIGLTNGR